MMTVQEIETKKTQLEAELNTALEAAKVLTPATPEFDDAYGRYLGAKAGLAKIPGELAATKRAENANAIKADCAVLADGIGKLVAGMGLEAKLGSPVISVVWTQGAAGIDGVVPAPVVHINPTVKSVGNKRVPTSSGGSGRARVRCPNGEFTTPTRFVLDHATDAEKASPEYKYPHGLVSTQPKFETFCLAHNLIGYERIKPVET